MVVEMKPKAATPRRIFPCPSAERYITARLSHVVQAIVETLDPDAMHELHENRTVFRLNGSGPMRLAEFADGLARRATAQGRPCADKAYDLTIDKFSRIPASDNGNGSGVDCRNYLRPFLDFIAQREPQWNCMSELEREGVEARALQNHVTQHFRLSLLECQRNNDMTRYTWHLPGGSLSLLMPRALHGRARRAWLDQHVVDVDPMKQGERDRVQALIYERFGKASCVPFHDERRLDAAWPWRLAAPPPWTGLDPVPKDGLAGIVAEEKTERIEEQRPAVQALGTRPLRALILRIFDDIEEGCYNAAVVARKFDLSKAALSRFAGIHWNDDGRLDAIPDLWRNTAHVLASDPVFVEVAQQAGVWPRIRGISEWTSSDG